MRKTLSLLMVLLLVLCFGGCADDSVSSIQNENSSVIQNTLSSNTGNFVSSESTSSLVSEEQKVESTTTSSSKKDNTLRVATFNIKNGAVVSHNMSLIANDITRNDVDIVGFQEVDYLGDRSQNIDTMKLLSQFTGYKYYAFYKAINLPGDSDGEYGLGILSRHPITEATKTMLDSFGGEQRILAHAVIDVDGTKINFLNTHLDFRNTENRTSQMNQISSFITDKKNVFLTGDFNVRGASEFDNIKNLSYVMNSGIDNIYYSDKFKFQEYKVDEANHSDHKMIYADFIIK